DDEVERVDVGRYRLTITAANTGRHSYRAWCTGEYAGAAERYFDVRPSAVLAAEGSGGEDDAAYCDDDDLDVIFGKTNVDRWADLDNDVDTTRIARRRLWARNLASATLDDRLRAGPYELPFSDPVPAVVVDLSARLAGLLLYDSRGSQDVDSEQ